MITVYPKPVADFLPRPAETDILDATVSFDNLSSNTFFCYWTFGDGNTSNDTEPVHQYTDTGSHQVYLYIQTEYGCRDTATEAVRIKESVTFYAPNAFTPDHNGSNETFLVKGSGIDNSTFSMMIFDRWGQLVFESEDLFKGWDGSIRGREADETAVYAWVVRFRDITGRHHIYRGSVILIR
jgi:gliding motility-associated-like protein